MKLGLVLLGGAALLVRSTTGVACGAQDEPYYVPSEQWPEGDSVPPNAPLVVALSENADGPAEAHLNPSLTLTVQGEDEAVELATIGSAPRLVWVPAAPLAARTTYEAHFNTGYEGAPDHIWQFTTGDELTPPVAVEGGLSATFESGTDPIVECHNNCGTDCEQVGTQTVVKARVQLPRARLGFPAYSGELWVTDTTPYDFSRATQAAHLVSLSGRFGYEEGGIPAQEALLTVPVEAMAYRPCFAFRLTDERGDHAIAPSLCAEHLVARAEEQPLQPPGLWSTSKPESSACSFGAPATSHQSALLLLAVTLPLIQRRRSKSAH